MTGLAPLIDGAGGGSSGGGPGAGLRLEAIFEETPLKPLLVASAPVLASAPRAVPLVPPFDLIYPPETTLAWPAVPDYFIIQQMRGEVFVVGNPVSYGNLEHILTAGDIMARLRSAKKILQEFEAAHERLWANWNTSLTALADITKTPDDSLIRNLQKAALEIVINGVWDDSLGSALHKKLKHLTLSFQEKLKPIKQAASDFSLYPQDKRSIAVLFQQTYGTDIDKLYYSRHLSSIESRLGGLKRVQTLCQKMLQMIDLRAKVLRKPYPLKDDFLGVVEYIPIGIYDRTPGIPSDIIGISQIVITERPEGFVNFPEVEAYVRGTAETALECLAHNDKRQRTDVEPSCGE